MAESTSAEEWLEMSHPTLPDAMPAAVSRTAFELVWQPLGWQLSRNTVTATEAATPTPDAAPRRKAAAPAASKED